MGTSGPQSSNGRVGKGPLTNLESTAGTLQSRKEVMTFSAKKPLGKGAYKGGLWKSEGYADGHAEGDRSGG